MSCVQWFPRFQHRALQNHFPPAGLGSGLFGFCLQMWPVLHTHSRCIARADCTEYEPRRPCPGAGRCAQDRAQEPQPQLSVRKEKQHPLMRQCRAFGCLLLPLLQTEKQSPGEKVTKLLDQLLILFPISCSNST